jgi:hypothetical protein
MHIYMPKKKRLLSIPKPAHPLKRKEALPWQKPKPISEDPAIANKLEAIFDNSCIIGGACVLRPFCN